MSNEGVLYLTWLNLELLALGRGKEGHLTGVTGAYALYRDAPVAHSGCKKSVSMCPSSLSESLIRRTHAAPEVPALGMPLSAFWQSHAIHFTQVYTLTLKLVMAAKDEVHCGSIQLYSTVLYNIRLCYLGFCQ